MSLFLSQIAYSWKYGKYTNRETQTKKKKPIERNHHHERKKNNLNISRICIFTVHMKYLSIQFPVGVCCGKVLTEHKQQLKYAKQ